MLSLAKSGVKKEKPSAEVKAEITAESEEEEVQGKDVKSSPARNGISNERKDPVIQESDEEPPPVKKRKKPPVQAGAEEDEEPVSKRKRRLNPAPQCPPQAKHKSTKSTKSQTVVTERIVPTDQASLQKPAAEDEEESLAETESELSGEDEDVEKPLTTKKTREKIQATLKTSGKDSYPDWKPGEPVPYAALCTTFLPIELTTKRLIILAHCSLFLRQVLRLTPSELLPTVQLMINKLAADYAGIELGIGESLIMKAIGEATGRSLAVIKADHNEIGDLGLVAAKSRSNQPTMFKPKPLTVKGVLDSLMVIATITGNGAQQRKVDGIKKLLAAADIEHAGKGSKGIDITKDKGGPSEAKYIVRFLEGKLRLGLAERTVLVALAHAVITHEVKSETGKIPSQEKLAEAESILKTVYRYIGPQIFKHKLR